MNDDWLVDIAFIGSESTITHAMTNDWILFLDNLRVSGKKEDRKKLKELLSMFTQCDALSSWLAVSFSSAWSDCKCSSNKTIDVLYKELISVKSFLKKAIDLKQQLEVFDYSGLAQPKHFKKIFDKLCRDFFQPITTKEFLGIFDQRNQLGKVVVIHILTKFIDVFDQSIKTLTGSTSYADIKIKVKCFQSMVRKYFSLFKVISSMSYLTKEVHALLEEGRIKDNTIELYQGLLFKLIKRASSKELTFRASLSFNVSGAALGSKARWERSVGSDNTLEDVFSLIHQNLLILMGVFTKKILGLNFVENEFSRNIFKQINNNLKKVDVSRYDIIGIGFKKSIVEYVYNVPMRNHSASFTLTCDYKRNVANISLKFMGIAWDRWSYINSISKAVSYLYGISFSKKPILDEYKGLLTFEWQISCSKEIDVVIYYLAFCLAYANGSLIGYASVLFADSVNKFSNFYNFDLSSSDCDVQSKLSALRILVDGQYKQAYDLVFKVAKDICCSSNCEVQSKLSVLRILVDGQYKQVYDLAFKVAKDICCSSDCEVQSKLSVLRILVDGRYEQAYDLAFKVAKDICSKELDSTTMLIANKTLQGLVDARYEKAYDLAFEIVKKNLNKRSEDKINEENEMMLEALVVAKYEGACEFAIKTAVSYLKKIKKGPFSTDLLDCAKDLFIEMIRIRNKKAYQSAIQIVVEYSQNTIKGDFDGRCQDMVVEISKALIEVVNKEIISKLGQVVSNLKKLDYLNFDEVEKDFEKFIKNKK